MGLLEDGFEYREAGCQKALDIVVEQIAVDSLAAIFYIRGRWILLGVANMGGKLQLCIAKVSMLCALL